MSKANLRSWRRAPWTFVGAGFLSAALALAVWSPDAAVPRADAATALSLQEKDAAARESFLAAYTVFMHARCMNCHPAGEIPLQGDDGRPHAMNPVRGKDGKGKYAMKCTNCHQDHNTPGENMPPGSPVWHLPPADMKMVFEGKSAGELCRQLKDPKLNGGKTLEQMFEHVSKDALVAWGWDPGQGRSKPPLSHEEFARKIREWIDNGAACPD